MSPLAATSKPRMCAVYSRVSKSDGSQSTASQIGEIEKLVAAKGLKVVARYEDAESAVKFRPGYEKMMADVRKPGCKWSALVVGALDRSHRSVFGSIQMVLELDRLGVEILSCREPWLSEGGPAVRSLLVSIFGFLAEAERSSLIARTRAGLSAARARGVRLGRAPVAFDLARARDLHQQGLGVRAIAATLGVSPATAARRLREAARPRLTEVIPVAAEKPNKVAGPINTARAC